ncbi:MAG: hypothetical protein ACLFPH_07145 [Bacteroidales bacterium]
MPKTTKKETQKIPKQALCFEDEAVISLSSDSNNNEEGKEQKKASMLVYSGKKMNHWFWDDVIIDVQGIDFQKKGKYPILENHSIDRKIGFAENVELDNKVFFPEIKLLSNAHAEEFYNNADEGFPYQASISIRPTLIERVEKEESTEVNGAKLKGPLTVFRKSIFREGSVCVFGVDSKTNTSVFSENETDNIEYDVMSFSEENETEFNNEQEDQIMNLEELKAKYPDLVKEVENSVKTEMDKVIEAKDKEIKDLGEKVTSLSEEKTTSEKRIADLEKRETIRTEKEIKASADAIFSNALSESSIPERIHAKVQKHVNYSDYVKEGSFDKEEFSKAVNEEIKDWEKNFELSDNPVIKGISTKKTENVDNSDDESDRLLGYVAKENK